MKLLRDNMKLLRDLPFSRNQPLKWADEYYIRILKKGNRNAGCLTWNRKKIPGKLDHVI
jgi:hypothetical protein